MERGSVTRRRFASPPGALTIPARRSLASCCGSQSRAPQNRRGPRRFGQMLVEYNSALLGCAKQPTVQRDGERGGLQQPEGCVPRQMRAVAGTQRRPSTVGPAGSGPVSPRPEESVWLLLVKPPEEFLKPRIGLDSLDGVEPVAQFVMRPGLVDEIFAGVTGWRRLRPALATRDHVMPARGHLAFAKHATLEHTRSSPWRAQAPKNGKSRVNSSLSGLRPYSQISKASANRIFSARSFP